MSKMFLGKNNQTMDCHLVDFEYPPRNTDLNYKIYTGKVVLNTFIPFIYDQKEILDLRITDMLQLIDGKLISQENSNIEYYHGLEKFPLEHSGWVQFSMDIYFDHWRIRGHEGQASPVQFLSFSCSFRPNNRLAPPPPLGLAPPCQGNPGSATLDGTFSSVYAVHVDNF